jgi:type I restriction enzyme S subunit
MSKIDELIAELCPEGVEFKKIKEAYQRIKGTPITAGKMKEIEDPDGEIRVFAGGKTVINAREEDIPNANITRVPAVLVQSRGVIDFIFYDGPFTFKNEMWAYTNKDRISVKFLYYVLKNNVEHFREAASGMGSLPQISLPVTEEFVVPVPPLEVQREIVRVLDNFTFLSAELSAELQARKKQYEYYRDTLLSFDNKIPIVPLKDIAIDIYRGAGIKRDEVTEDGIPCVRYGEIYTTYNTWFKDCVSHTKLEYVPSPKYFEHGDVLFAITGESVEDIAKSVVYMGNEKCLAGGDIVVLKHNQNPRYMAHVLSTQSAREQKSRGKVKSKVVHSSVPSIENIEIPIPPLDVQERYADVLDNFETICNDLKIGLPAEIEARQKQYEYYRDALLTFAESGTIISRQTDRQTDRQSIIRLIQYVFGYAHITLGDVGKVSMCKRIMKDETSTEGEVPFFKIGTFGGIPDAFISQKKYDEYTSKYSFPQKGDILISAAGTIGRAVIYNGEKAYFQDSNIVWIANDESIVLNDYLYYLYQLQPWKVSTGGTIARLYNDNISSAEVDVPSISEQKRIVDVLRHFDDLCNNLSEGLPAEIEARQKQYEYYRDKLLSFKGK